MPDKFQGYYTVNQIDDMVTAHSEGKLQVVGVRQENNQFVVETNHKNNIRIKIRAK
jgi:hypothetical protein